MPIGLVVSAAAVPRPWLAPQGLDHPAAAEEVHLVDLGHRTHVVILGVFHSLIDAVLTRTEARRCLPDSVLVKEVLDEAEIISVATKPSARRKGVAQQLMAAVIRKERPPEPYKGKGIRYQGEYVRMKAGKSGKTCRAQLSSGPPW